MEVLSRTGLAGFGDGNADCVPPASSLFVSDDNGSIHLLKDVCQERICGQESRAELDRKTREDWKLRNSRNSRRRGGRGKACKKDDSDCQGNNNQAGMIVAVVTLSVFCLCMCVFFFHVACMDDDGVVHTINGPRYM